MDIISRKIETFIGKKSLTKTLRFRLIPQGKTEENLEALLAEDESRATDYDRLKDLIKDYHKDYITRQLSGFQLDGLQEYSKLYFAPGDNSQKLDGCGTKMMKDISSALKKGEEYKEMLGKDIIKLLLKDDQRPQEDIAVIKRFERFSTYFTNFNNNMENIYADEAKATTIANRIINDNLPKFLDNIYTVKNKEIINKLSLESGNIFTEDYFNNVLTQKGIEDYNYAIGDINKAINLYNQAHKERKEHLPQLKALYKQILSDRESAFKIEEFDKNCEPNVIPDAINKCVGKLFESSKDDISVMEKLKKLFSQTIYTENDGIFVESKYITTISQKLYNDWSVIPDELGKAYDSTLSATQRSAKTYDEKKKKFLNDSKNLAYLQKICDGINIEGIEKVNVAGKLSEIFNNLIDDIDEKRNDFEKQTFDKKIKDDAEATTCIKAYLDSILNLNRFINVFVCAHAGAENSEFYGYLMQCVDVISNIVPLYNKIRNNVTQKPYSEDKIKLCFNNYQLMDGWSKNKEPDYRCIMLRKDGLYYLGVVRKDAQFPIFNADDSGDNYEKMECDVIKSQSIFSLMLIDGKAEMKKGRKTENGENKILEQARQDNYPDVVYKLYKENGFSIKKDKVGEADFVQFIDYFKKCVTGYWSKYKFNFKPSNEYNSFVEDFVEDVSRQAYQLSFVNVSARQIDTMVKDGELYLFQIYNKDFSQNKKAQGTDNMHTMYFKMLFDAENFKSKVFKLSGGGEIFIRKASLPYKVTHPKNVPLENKCKSVETTYSTFEYDLIKDKRFTHDEYSLHLPMEINFNAKEDKSAKLYIDVRSAIKQSEHNYIIGIDRGERNLLSICVIDDSGKIVEQRSLNVIHPGERYEKDYNKLLTERAVDMVKARKDWQTIGNIKNIKEGYLSQAIHEICLLMEKYDALIVLENLNRGFKNSRAKFEQQIYQKFESMLTTKLNYLAFKNRASSELGSVMKGYQLCDAWNDKLNQNGFIFYIPAEYTSKIDPTTGFVNLIKAKYETILDSQKLIEKFDGIYYSKPDGCFAFKINYDNFDGTTAMAQKEWMVYSHGERLMGYKNQYGEWKTTTVYPTNELKDLFEIAGIEYESGRDIKADILRQTGSDFFKALLKQINLTLQMRNSCAETNEDYIVSPVKGKDGTFFDSRKVGDDMPKDADANGAYHIALKGLMVVNKIKQAESDEEISAGDVVKIDRADWFAYRQNR